MWTGLGERSWRWLTASAVGATAWLATTPAQALVPPTITHQGRLFDMSANPVTGKVDLTFALYDAVDSLDPIWIETHSVDFDEGYFSVQLGSIEAFDSSVFDGSSRWLGITVDADPEMTPRAEIASVPRVLKDPGPGAQLTGFGADGLDLTLNFWIGDPENGQLNIRSDVNRAILQALRAQGIRMPPPQLADHDRRVVVPARLKRREQDRRSLGCLLALGHEPQL